MKVTISVESGGQDIEISREGYSIGGDRNRLLETGKLLNGAAEDVRRALDLAPDSGTILAAWHQIVTLAGADDPQLSPASVVDRVALALEQRGESHQTLVSKLLDAERTFAGGTQRERAEHLARCLEEST